MGIASRIAGYCFEYPGIGKYWPIIVLFSAIYGALGVIGFGIQWLGATIGEANHGLVTKMGAGKSGIFANKGQYPVFGSSVKKTKTKTY